VQRAEGGRHGEQGQAAREHPEQDVREVPAENVTDP